MATDFSLTFLLLFSLFCNCKFIVRYMIADADKDHHKSLWKTKAAQDLESHVAHPPLYHYRGWAGGNGVGAAGFFARGWAGDAGGCVNPIAPSKRCQKGTLTPRRRRRHCMTWATMTTSGATGFSACPGWTVAPSPTPDSRAGSTTPRAQPESNSRLFLLSSFLRRPTT